MSNQSDERRLRFVLKPTGNDGFTPIPGNGGPRTNLVDLSSAYSVPLLAQDQMRRYLGNLEWGEELGFDAIGVMEQRTPAIYPSSTVAAAWLIARTSRIHVGAAGPVSGTYFNPLKIAEEIAMLDVMSGGRIFFGFPLGIGPAYHQMGANPTIARRRHAEAVNLIRRALTEREPFEFRGEFFNLPYVNLWPQPINRSMETWIPGTGSRESQVEAARGRDTYLLFLNGREGLKRNGDAFRQIARDEFGYEPERKQIAVDVWLYVAETDKQARKEIEPHLMWFLQNVLPASFEDYTPPGLSTVSSLKAKKIGKSNFNTRPEDLTFEDVTREGMAIVGSPETVTAELERLIEEVGAGQVVCMADCGNAPEWKVRKSLDLFAREVMPKFRPPGGRPIWDEEHPLGFRTISEAGARLPDPPAASLSRIDGETYKVYDAHVDELRVPVHPNSEGVVKP